ncbi:uncharacterized protein LOC109726733 [Ananas comosus]|uniref:Uncharacterized protein LOC109726733 n=1 Tax=Ananas comosus TaxID=4615 RepID=A0A6P5GW56_ANACO|nr:uncharacterized protein LOC109726733 [Ananas comosus]
MGGQPTRLSDATINHEALSDEFRVKHAFYRRISPKNAPEMTVGEVRGRCWTAAGSSRWRGGGDRARTLPLGLELAGGEAATGGGRGGDDPVPETKGEVVLTSEGNGSAREWRGSKVGPHRTRAAAGDLGGGRRGAGTAGDARAGLLEVAGVDRGAWPQGKCGPKARNLSSAWLGSGQTRLAAASSGGSGDARGWPGPAGEGAGGRSRPGEGGALANRPLQGPSLSRW